MTRQQILAHSCLIFCQSPQFSFRPYNASNLGGITTFVVCIPCTCIILQNLLFHQVFIICITWLFYVHSGLSSLYCWIFAEI